MLNIHIHYVYICLVFPFSILIQYKKQKKIYSVKVAAALFLALLFKVKIIQKICKLLLFDYDGKVQKVHLHLLHVEYTYNLQIHLYFKQQLQHRHKQV